MRATNNSWIHLCLLVALGVLIYYPSLEVMPYITEGDTGRDLYAYELTLEGQIPYRDYYWTYGPLMPFYYALCFKLFGVKITSVLAGRMVLNLISGLFVFGSLRLFFGPLFGIFGTLWFWSFNQDFTYTFNHTGGVLLVLLIIYQLLRMINRPGSSHHIIISAALFLLLLVKINIGLAALLATAVAYLIFLPKVDLGSKRPWGVIAMIVGLPLVMVGLVYWTLLRNVPTYFLFQCLPVMPGYEASGVSFTNAVKVFIGVFAAALAGTPTLDKTSLFLSPWPFQVMLFLGSFALISVLTARGAAAQEKRAARNGLLTILIFMVLFTHEFWASGIDYRLWWNSSLAILVFLLSLGFMLEGKPVIFRRGMIALLLVTVILEVNGKYLFWKTIRQEAGQFLPMERAQIYVNNPPAYIRTVIETAESIESRMNANETFVAIPYNPIYHFLTDRSSPIREVAFYERQHVTEEQERRIVADLERAQNRWILLSNRAFSAEPGLGSFGDTYCPLLGKYVRENYAAVESIGDWRAPAGWAQNNAVKFLQKKMVSDHQ